jgi:hypothetical protein
MENLPGGSEIFNCCLKDERRRGITGCEVGLSASPGRRVTTKEEYL